MFYTPIPLQVKSRNWIAHGDALPVSSPDPLRDHRDARRLGSFVRLGSDEIPREHVPALHQPLAVVRQTCDPRVIKRSYVAAPPNDRTFPDFGDVAGEAGQYAGAAFDPRPLAGIAPKAIERWRPICSAR